MTSGDFLLSNINPKPKREDLNLYVQLKPQFNQNLSETSSPQRTRFTFPRPEDGYSPCSSDYFLSSASDCEIFNQNNENVKIYLVFTRDAQHIPAYEGGKVMEEDFRKFSRKQRKRVFDNWIREALNSHRGYRIEEAWSYVKEARNERDRLHLNDQEANTFEVLFYYIKGRVSLYRRNFRRSLQVFEKAADILQKKPNYELKKLFYLKQNIAKAHYVWEGGDREKAESLLKESLQYGEENNDNEHKAHCYFQLTELYLILKKISEAKDYLKLCIEAAHQIPDRNKRLFFIARNIRNEGDLNFRSGEKAKGIHCYEIALGLLRSILPEANILNENYSHEMEEYPEETGVSEMTF